MTNIDEKESLTVLMVSYNTRALTLRAIETLYANTTADFELLVADNASSDGSADSITDSFPNVRLLKLESNIGFAAANNKLASFATSSLMLLLNPDTEILPGSVDELLRFRKAHSSAGIWGGRTLFADGRQNPSSCWHRQTVGGLIMQALGLNSIFRSSSLFNPERVSLAATEYFKRVEIVSGCYLLIDRALWQRLGGFNPAFFMYGEDADLCLRAISIGACPAVTGRSSIIHHGGQSEKNDADKLVRLITAKRKLIEVHFPSGSRAIARLLLDAWPLSRLVAHKLLSKVSSRNHLEKVQCWQRVWSKRDLWRNL